VRITYNVKGYIDRRSLSICMHQAELVEKEWRRRVSLNPKERARLERQNPNGKVYLIKQAG
jgi:Cdc6-like AAA superfamily ATPase